MSITMTKVPFNSYIDALNHARDTDGRIKASLSTPIELAAKVRGYYKQVADEYGRALSVEEFQSEHAIVRVAYRGTEPVAGYLIIGSELVGLFSLARGKGDWIMGHAVSDGADHLDCFAEPALLKLYHKHGFKIHHSEANYDPAGLPVVYMSR